MKTLVAALALSSSPWTAAFGAQSSGVEQTIRSLDDQERVAALNRDVAALERLWSEDFVVNAPNNKVVAGRKAVLDVFVRGNIINFSTFERTIEHAAVDGDFAAIMGLETVTSKGDASSAGLVAGQAIRRRFTNIWKNEGGTWRLYWRHANVLPAATAGDTAAENERIVRRLYDELYSKWNFAVVDELFSPDFVSHDMPPGLPRGPEGVRQFYGMIRAGLPDVTLKVEDVVATGDRVVVRWRAKATHGGPFLGIPATGKPVSFGGIAVYRLANGKAVERWVEVGLLGVAEQLRAP